MRNASMSLTVMRWGKHGHPPVPVVQGLQQPEIEPRCLVSPFETGKIWTILLGGEDCPDPALHAPRAVLKVNVEHVPLQAGDAAHGEAAGGDGDRDVDREPGLAELLAAGEDAQAFGYVAFCHPSYRRKLRRHERRRGRSGQVMAAASLAFVLLDGDHLSVHHAARLSPAITKSSGSWEGFMLRR
jgi:hypothetical protein